MSLRAALWVAGLAGLSACASAARPRAIDQHPPSGRRPGVPHETAAQGALLRAPAPARQSELFVRCENKASCPSAVGMLVVEGAASGAEPERCTVALIAADRALTASHCLAPASRHPGAACDQTWVSFPETADAPAETADCARVLSAVEIEGGDPLRQEYAVLQLARRLERGALGVDPTPPAQGSIVTVVSVTPHPVHGSTHALTTRLCRAIDSEPAERALGSAAREVGWLASCPIAHGNSGSPVLDYAGRIRAIVHGGTSPSSAYAVTSAPSE